MQHNRLQSSPAMRRLIEEDAVGQLRRQEGEMRRLGSENGEVKLDWVEGVARLLAADSLLEQVEQEARAIWQQGIRHIIWAGMGGSVITVRVLAALGFCTREQEEQIAIYPLDSTDPAALNTILRSIAAAKGINLQAHSTPSSGELATLFADVMLIGVSMGMTSEEPITHLQWFTALLEQAQLVPAEHLLVMTLPGSYLDQFAQEHQAPSRPLQPDRGTGTGGRMSAPTTRVFLLPVALYLLRFGEAPGQLRTILSRAWQDYDLELATRQPAEHPFVQLAVALYEASQDGACRLLFETPEAWRSLHIWIEQLLEESLGKGGKGVVAFVAQSLNQRAADYRSEGLLRVQMTAELLESADHFALYQPYSAGEDPHERLATLAASFLGWQLTMALYGYLHTIQFAGQPAVENYKARARTLRALPDPLQAIASWPQTLRDGVLTLLAPAAMASASSTPAASFAAALKTQALGYLDCTYNGEAPVALQELLTRHMRFSGNELLGIPVKMRQGPADYHSTEQSEMDGPPSLLSLRILVTSHEKVLRGSYDDTFLRAQAVSTWQALIEQGRSCFLLLIDGDAEQAVVALERFFQSVSQTA